MSLSPQPAELPPAGTASALELTLRRLRPYLARPNVTELCINEPGVAFLETRDGWRRESIPFASFDWCRNVAKLVANSTRQRIDEESPLLTPLENPPFIQPGPASSTLSTPVHTGHSVHPRLKKSGLSHGLVAVSTYHRR
jgi:type IV secretion system protein VirB11